MDQTTTTTQRNFRIIPEAKPGKIPSGGFLLDLVDLGEIASRLNVARDTPNHWRKRGKLPEPLALVNGGPVWQWDTIAEWHANR